MIASVLLILIFALCLIIYSNMLNINTYLDYIDKQTIFVCNNKPELTCIVVDINKNDIINNRIELLVTYSSGNKMTLFTTINEFEKLWTIYW